LSLAKLVVFPWAPAYATILNVGLRFAYQSVAALKGLTPSIELILKFDVLLIPATAGARDRYRYYEKVTH